MRRQTGRAAFTIVEVIVVVTIIAVVIGLMLPAIVASREAAKRTACVNNLRQITLGLQNYQEVHHVFPPGVVNPTGPVHNRPDDFHISWVIQVLPFMEQSGLAVDTDLPVYVPPNAGVARSRLSSLICPSDPGAGVVGGVGTSSYAGCHHDVEAPIDADNHGVLFLNSHVAREDISDGTSFTLSVGEKLVTPSDLGWISGTRSTLRNTGTPINAAGGPSPPDPERLFVGGFSSKHPGGANFGLADGSVRFVPETVSPAVYRLLGHRADGEPISAGEF